MWDLAQRKMDHCLRIIMYKSNSHINVYFDQRINTIFEGKTSNVQKRLILINDH